MCGDLLTRVAYVDLDISQDEQQSIAENLVFLELDEETALKVRDIAVKNIVQLKGLKIIAIQKQLTN